MVEIEISVLREQCLDRRTGNDAVLNTEVAAWRRQRNSAIRHWAEVTGMAIAAAIT